MSLSADVGLDLVKSKIKRLTDFLDFYLKIANAHTVDFYTKDVWNELVAVTPETVISGILYPQAENTREGKGGSVWDQSQKLNNVAAYMGITRDHSLPNLGVCTPLDNLQQELWGDKQKEMFLKTSTFMNTKKSHEVEVMSEIVACFAKYCNIQQVIDVGSGKGYLSSYLSMQYGLSVYGIDSSTTNTIGANERNRKLERYWKVYQRQTKPPTQISEPEHPKEEQMHNVENVTEIKEQVGLVGEQAKRTETLRGHGQSLIQTPISTTFGDSEIYNKNNGETSAETFRSDEYYGSENAFLEFLSTDAVEVASQERQNKYLDDKEKERRKNAGLEAKAKRIKEANLYSPITLHVTSTTELHDIASDVKDSMVVGLHTCGDLASSTLRIFITKPEIKAVCSVGCCYHLLSEEFELLDNKEVSSQGPWGFPMSQYLRSCAWHCGRNARMSACLPFERVTFGHAQLPLESLFYRAVLQVIIKEHFGNEETSNTVQRTKVKHVGKIYFKSSSFVDYTRKATEKLGMDSSKMSANLIQGYYDRYMPRMKELEAFNLLKVALAPCIEGLILLDRLCYLKEQQNVAWSALVQLFDPVKSPRCYAIIGMKK
ncbi:methyltransferase-like protein 25 isoform X1 [Leucoraja erinacea]|uniref:methyltransferase-like protein 25 isoform X1 n=2 Tax=Leucoraja erinaceus TaxID=7782 RepID=UPI002458030C|nr:methyltransferase-like protein 25 isoform X1 [Leucoraja erinacea]